MNSNGTMLKRNVGGRNHIVALWGRDRSEGTVLRVTYVQQRCSKHEKQIMNDASLPTTFYYDKGFETQNMH